MAQTKTQNRDTAHEILTQEFKSIIVDYITKVNSRYRGNEFTSSQLAKTVMMATEMEKTRFPIVHRLVKEILSTWEEQGLCAHISRTKYSRCRKTKDTYRFKALGLKEIREEAIDGTIRRIRDGELGESPIMKTREKIIKDRIDELVDNALATGIKPARQDA